MTDVLKIGGNQLDDTVFISGLAHAVAHLVQQGEPPVLVHGGGKLIGALQQKFGITPRTIGGLRVTDAESLLIVMMVLIGQVNPTLVSALQQAGVEAEGLNGADRGLLRAVPLTHPDGDLGHVGTITTVRAEVIRDVLARDVVPVIAPLGVGTDGGFFNVNADQAAGAIAAALGAERVTFVTNVPGVLADGHAIERLSQADARELIRLGVAAGGMAVKLEAAFNALAAGVPGARIVDLPGLIDGKGTLILA
ncbi:MAG: acetylglutamate kinase [Aggregatilineales bacterium]